LKPQRSAFTPVVMPIEGFEMLKSPAGIEPRAIPVELPKLVGVTSGVVVAGSWVLSNVSTCSTWKCTILACHL
jgi:hypothetical protein